MEKTRVYIDLGFLSKLSKYFGKGKPIHYCFNKLAKKISSKEKLWCEHILIYTAPPYQSAKPTSNEKKRKENHDKFVNSINKHKDMTLKLGRLQKIGKKYTQKGVDGLIIADLMEIPYKYPHLKKIIFIACDTDFVPIIQRLKTEKIQVILYTYQEKDRESIFATSNHLSQVCEKVVMLQSEDLKESIRKSEVSS